MKKLEFVKLKHNKILVIGLSSIEVCRKIKEPFLVVENRMVKIVLI